MSIVGAFMVPHPPLIVPAVGRGEERGIAATIAAYREVARRIGELRPETIVLTSPHATLYLDYFHVAPGAAAGGSFAQFGAPQAQMTCAYDQEFTGVLETLATQAKLPAGTRGERDPQLDHATMVPLYFVNQVYTDYKLVRIGLSGLSLQKHYQLGQLIAAAAAKLNRRVVFIASGDLSHKLKRSGPYGFDPAGPKYDKRIMTVMGSGAFDQLFSFDDTFCEEAAECGHRSFVIMAGALDGLAVKAEQLSYEGPFGVGYGVCAFTPTGTDEQRHFATSYDRIRSQMYQERLAKEDPYVKLARATIESYVKSGRRLHAAGKPAPGNVSGQGGGLCLFKRARPAAWLHRYHRSHAGKYCPGNHAQRHQRRHGRSPVYAGTAGGTTGAGVQRGYFRAPGTHRLPGPVRCETLRRHCYQRQPPGTFASQPGRGELRRTTD
jgi:AmmeMemoRadiSam system protein B